jgi:hypothetical protein
MRHYKLYLCLKLLELMRKEVAPENISPEWCDVEWLKYKELIKAGVLSAIDNINSQSSTAPCILYFAEAVIRFVIASIVCRIVVCLGSSSTSCSCIVQLQYITFV